MATNKPASFLSDFSFVKLPFGFYLLGSLIIILFSFIGQVPMFFFLHPEGVSGTSQADLFGHLDTNLTLFLLLIPSLFAFFGFLFVIKSIHKQSLRSTTTSREKIDLKRIGFGFAYWALISLGIFGVDLLLSPDDYQWNFNLQPFLLMLVISVALIPFQSALEEWIFRGYLMQGFATLTKSRFLTLVLTSVIFGSLHLFNPEIDQMGYGLLAYYIGTGFFFGIMSLMDEGIELAIGFHVANNLLTAILVTADWTAFQTASLYKDISSPSLGSELLLFLGLIYPLSLFVLAKKYQWNDWRHKLISTIDATQT
ncbi:MAG: lysostaphin resistance A-like protein [Flavobacteriaceae bacterium]